MGSSMESFIISRRPWLEHYNICVAAFLISQVQADLESPATQAGGGSFL